MRILFTRFPLESALGGAEIQTLSLMEGLIERGHAVAFAGSCPVLLAECRKRHIPAVEWQIGPPPVTKWGAVSFVWRKGKMRQKLQQLLDQFPETDNSKLTTQSSKLDIICMLSLSEKLLLTDVAATKNIKPIWIEHDPVGNWLAKNPWLKALLRQSTLATTITVSELSRKIYLGLGWDQTKTIAIPNGIDPARLQSKKPATRNAQLQSTLRLGCVARLSHEKGVDVLINAMKHVPDDITLEIVGRGPEETELKKLVASLKLESRITFSAPNPDIASVLNNVDALILPSRNNDPFGLVIAEGMMLGLPCIVTDACGIAGYLRDKTDALIVQADSIPALTQAISTLSDPHMFETLAINGPKTATEKFSAKRMVDAYELVFTQASPMHS